MRTIYKYILLSLLLAMSSCSIEMTIDHTIDELPEIYPDYTEVTIPANIAPLNFRLKSVSENACMIIKSDAGDTTIYGKNKQFVFPPSYWERLLTENAGKSIEITVCIRENEKWVAFQSFHIYIAEELIDPYIAYRLIEPGYTLWNQMGIYQRELASYSESAIIENKMTQQNCMNCHSFPNQNPNKMLFHMRGKLAGTILIDGNKIEKLNTRTNQTISSLVYPSWHPSEKYIAFTVNDTKQGFHTNNKNMVEVYDAKSDIVLYDIEKHEIFTTPSLFSTDAFESFPTFSPDGKTLYFCSADSCDMPRDYEKVRYSLCSISFDPEKRTLGHDVDTLFNARREGKSMSFPRISPDGKFLLYGKGDYGGFFIWHKEADLYMLNLTTGEHFPLEAANSSDAESYHSWSSNSRWITFASRRLDGLYSRIFISHIDKNGEAKKAFLLPQKDPAFYNYFMKSYNVPEFITGKVKKQSYSIAEEARSTPSANLKFILE